MQNRLTGKAIMITGCSSGIGIETARALAETGATLYLAVRNFNKARDAVSDLLSKYRDRVYLLPMDLESFESIRRSVSDFKKKNEILNVLICNAGIRSKTKDDNDRQFRANHLGHLLLFQLLKDMLISSSTPELQSRVVTVSSQSHRDLRLDFDDLQSPTDADKGYAFSKLANVYMANEIERRFSPQALHAWSVHPGAIQTPLNQIGFNRQALTDLMKAFRAGIMKVQRNLMSLEQGAATTVWAAMGTDLEGKGGKYLECWTISQPYNDAFDVATGFLEPGYAPWIYDEAAAERLWQVSLQLTASSDTL